MDKAGPMCRTALDCALVFEAIHGADPKDPATLTAPFAFDPKADLSKVRIGLTRGVPDGFVGELKKLGAEPTPMAALPSARGLGLELSCESAAAFDDFLAAGLQEKMQNKGRADAFKRGRSISCVDYLHSLRRRQQVMARMAESMKEFDLYVSMSGDLALTNLTGHPTLTLPYTVASGQPQVLMLVGDLFRDDLLLSVGAAYQRATNWHDRHPEL